MNVERTTNKIEFLFRNLVKNDPNLRNAYLLIHSPKSGIDINIAEGKTNGIPANPQQPNYMASVGKLFTSVVICKLYEDKKLSLEDPIKRYLDTELMSGLLIYKGKDYSNEIKIRHLLNHTSGLFDSFWPLLEKLMKEPKFSITPREAIIWGKDNCISFGRPGKKMKYTDTNYYLLGLIIEEVTGMTYDEVLLQYIFKPLKMLNSYVLHVSHPINKCKYSMASFFVEGIDLSKNQNFKGIDYAGGGVVATPGDLLIFMKALINGRVLQQKTLQKMMNKPLRFLFVHEYGFGIMRFTRVPLLEPKSYKIWGHCGATGSFLFYHPVSETYIIGNFNELSYTEKAVKFILMKVVSRLT